MQLCVKVCRKKSKCIFTASQSVIRIDFVQSLYTIVRTKLCPCNLVNPLGVFFGHSNKKKHVGQLQIYL
jgi:hypothetical protein